MAILFIDHKGIAHADHSALARKAKAMSTDALLWSARDASDAAKANPEGPKASYYADEVCAYTDELARRGAL